MRNLFLPEATDIVAEPKRPQGPVPFYVAFSISGANTPKPSRSLKRKGFAYIHEIAARPKRHGICRACSRRTWTSAEGTCRKCFLAGEGGLEVAF